MGAFAKIKDFFGVEDEYDYEYEYDEFDEVEEVLSKNAKDTNNNKNVITMNNNKSAYIVVVRPTCYKDSFSIGESINAKKIVVINLENVEDTLKTRIIDFITGAAFSNQTRIQEVANNTYITIPSTIGLEEGFQPEKED